MGRNVIIGLITFFVIIMIKSIPSSGQELNNEISGTYQVGLPSPTAASFAKQAETQIGLFTGTPSISIPLVDLEEYDLHLPISLSYSAKGVKVEEIADWVGMGWALNAGGVITRIMRGIPDEIFGSGYMSTGNQVKAFKHKNPTQQYDFLSDKIDNFIVDPEPDLFFYKFGGHSGKFVLDHGNHCINVYTIPLSNIDISCTITNNDITEFVIVTDNGTRYIFSDIEKNTLYGEQNLPPHVSSWYLSKIESASGDGIIEFEYYYSAPDTSHLVRHSHLSNEFIPFLVVNHTYGAPQEVFPNTSILNYQYRTYLKRIKSSKYTIHFYKEMRDDAKYGETKQEYKLTRIEVKENTNNETLKEYNFTYAYYSERLFLENLQELGRNSTEKTPYTFSYINPNSLPDRFSFAVDHWGYYNGENSNNRQIPTLSFVPDNNYINDYMLFRGANREFSEDHITAGTLNRIDYPTGGYTEFEYEPHDYSRVEITDSEDLIGTIQQDSMFHATVAETPESHVFDIQGDHAIVKVSLEWLTPNYGHQNGELYVKIFSNENKIKEYRTFFTDAHNNYFETGEGDTTEVFIVNNGTLRVETYIGHVDELLNVVLTIDENTIVAEKQGGGIRIKRKTIHDGLDSANDMMKEYLYHCDKSGTALSTGVMYREPQYSYWHTPGTAGSGGIMYFLALTSTPLRSFGMPERGFAGYRQVQVIHNDGSYEIHRFTDSSNIDPNMEGWDNAVFIASTDISSGYGLPESIEYWDSNNQLVKKIVNEYEFNDLVQYENTYREVPAIAYYKLGYAKISNYPVEYSDFPDFKYQPYDVISTWRHPVRKTQKIYYGNSIPKTNETDYIYDIVHKLLKRRTDTNSNGSQRIILYKYAHEKYPDMATLNMLSQLYSVTVRNSQDEDLQKRWRTWNDSIPGAQGYWVPLEQLQWDGAGSTAPDHPDTSNDIKSVGFDKYDTFGNVIKFTDANEKLTKLYYGDNDNPYSWNGLDGVSGVYLTGITKVLNGSDSLTVTARYDDMGRADRITDENDRHTYFGYDDFHRLISIRGHASSAGSAPLLQEIEYEKLYTGGIYGSPDNHNRIITRHHAGFGANNIRTFVEYFDGLGRPIQSQQDVGNNDAVVTHTFYDAMGREEIITKPITWSTGLDFLIRDDLVGSNWTPGEALPASSALFTYHNTTLGFSSDDSGYAYSQTAYRADPLGRAERQASPGWLYRMNASIDRTVGFEYGINQQDEPYNGALAGTYTVTTTIDEEGNRSRTYADGFGNTIATVTEMSIEADLVTLFEYDLLGNLLKVTDPRGLETLYEYDKLGRLTTKSTPDTDAGTQYRYDKNGNLRFIRNAGHKVSQSGLSTIYYGGSDFSVNRSFSKTTDLRLSGQIDVGTYALFELTITDNNTGTLILNKELEFTSMGNAQYDTTVPAGSYAIALALIDGTVYYDDLQIDFYTHQYHYFKYDKLNRVVEEGVYFSTSLTDNNVNNPSFPLSNRRILVKRHYDSASSGTNQKGRLAEVEYLDPLTDRWGKTVYSYTNEGQVAWVRQHIPGLSNKTINYSYNRAGQIVERNIDGFLMTQWTAYEYLYDPAGRLDHIRDKEAHSLYAGYTYNASGQLHEKTLGNNAQKINYSYNIRGWLQQMNDPADMSVPGAPDARFAMSLDYTHNGNISDMAWNVDNGVSNENPRFGYSYDSANRLIGASFITDAPPYEPDYTYSYDPNGNLTSMGGDYYNSSFVMNANNNRISQWSRGGTPYSLSYDPNGNVVSHERRGIENTTYNSAHQPIRISVDGETISSVYDGDGNRVKKTFSGGSTLYYLRGADGQTLAVYDQDGELLFVNILTADGAIIGKINP